MGPTIPYVHPKGIKIKVPVGQHSHVTRTGCVGGQSKKRSIERYHSGLMPRQRTGCVGGQSKKRSIEKYHSQDHAQEAGVGENRQQRHQRED